MIPNILRWTESAASLPPQVGDTGCSEYVLVDCDGTGQFAFGVVIYDGDEPSSWDLVEPWNEYETSAADLDLTDVQYWTPLPLPAAHPSV